MKQLNLNICGSDRTKATIEVNGKPVIGNPFMREGWRSAIGRPGSSCCFALAETMMGSI